MSRKTQSASKIDRRFFLKSGAKILPSLAVLGLGLIAVTPARAGCYGSCSGSCTDSCSGDCMGSCRGSCGGCDNTCTNSSK